MTKVAILLWVEMDEIWILIINERCSVRGPLSLWTRQQLHRRSLLIDIIFYAKFTFRDASLQSLTLTHETDFLSRKLAFYSLTPLEANVF